MHADETTMRFIGGVMHPNVTWRSMATMVGHWALRGYGMFSFIEKESGRWIGRGGPWNPHGWPQPEVGWGLTKDAQGKGYALEGAVACIDYVVETLGWRGVIHCIDKDNTPSKRLAEKLGSVWLREVDPPKPYEGFQWQVYGQTAKDWLANRARLIKPA